MGKKYIESSKLVDKNVLYTPAEALDLAVKTAKAKFDETIELHVRLGVDPRHATNKLEELLFFQTELVKALKY